MTRLKIAPSILAADFRRLGEQVEAAEAAGVDYIHCDMMDGHFVPPITFGPLLIEAVHRSTSLPLDVHLMVEEPERYIEHVAKAGGSIFTFHLEASAHLDRVVSEIKRAGMRAGLAINPATPAVMLEEILPSLDLVLVMSINPGWGGQPFMPSVLPKLRKVRAMIDELGLATELEIDGGVKDSTIKQSVEAGATVLVAGTAIFNEHESVQAAVNRLRREIDAAAPSG